MRLYHDNRPNSGPCLILVLVLHHSWFQTSKRSTSARSNHFIVKMNAINQDNNTKSSSGESIETGIPDGDYKRLKDFNGVVPNPWSSLELWIVTILVCPILFMYIFMKGNPNERGFFCDDYSLKYPIKEEKISSNACAITWIALTATIFLTIEILHWADSRSRKSGFPRHRSTNIRPAVIESYRIMVYGLTGATGCMLTTELAKLTIGRLRPYYLTMCNIELTKDLCEDAFGNAKFIEHPHNCQLFF